MAVSGHANIFNHQVVRSTMSPRRTSLKPDDDGDEAMTNEATVVVFGATKTGKTAVVSRLVRNQFTVINLSPEEHDTLDVQKDSDHFRIRFYNPSVKVDVPWPAVVRREISKADAFLLIYAINNRKSFNTALKYLEKISTLTGNKDSPSLFVGNKVDLLKQRSITPAEAELRALQWDTGVQEVSAKGGCGVTELKRTLYQMIKMPPKFYLQTRRRSSIQKLFASCMKIGETD